MVRIRVLGPVELVLDGQAVPVSRPVPGRLLTILALAAGEVVSVERLIDDLWCDDPPMNPAAALHTAVSRLRALLPKAGASSVELAIETWPSGYCLVAPPGTIDALAVEPAVRNARDALARGDPAEALARSSEALRLFTDGPPLAAVLDTERLRPFVERLTELQAEAAELRAAALSSAGRYDESLAELRELTLRHPHRERLWAMLMRAEYAAGRPADALSTFQRARRLLADDLGLEPGPELVVLEQQILTHDLSELALPKPSIASRISSDVIGVSTHPV